MDTFVIRTVALLAWITGGCYSPTIPAGAPCARDSQCPLEQHCVAPGVCELATDAGSVASRDGVVGPSNDVDADGVLNDDDNCPTVFNPDQGNEDGDRFGDLCDPCPIFANDTPSDPDNDGVSDSCDPNPSNPGDQIVLFEGFHHGLPPSWVISGDVVEQGDGLQLSSPDASKATAIVPMFAPVHGTLMIGASPSSVVHDVTSVFGGAMPYDPTPQQGIFCGLRSITSGSTTARSIVLSDSTALFNLGFIQYDWSLGAAATMRMSRSGSDYSCAASIGGSQPASVSGKSSYIPPISNIGVFAKATTGTIAWVLVISSPG